MRLFLVRHGQTDWNAEERAQGHTDIPLNQVGRCQAARLADRLADSPLSLVLSSDLQRSTQTAEPVVTLTGASLETTPLLRERTFGEWEGLPYGELASRFNGIKIMSGIDSVHQLSAPGGESLEEAWVRIEPILERCRSTAEPTLIVSHGGICTLLLTRLIGADIKASAAFRFRNCAITELERRPDSSFRLVRFNDDHHLTNAEPIAEAAR